VKTNKRTKRTARQLFRLCHVDGRLDAARARLVATRVGGSSRRGTLGILSEFVRLVRLDREAHRAVIESATGLTDDLRRRVEADLARTYGDGLEASFELKPELIGGMRIRVGSDVYDASVRAKLAALEARW
jgi:F-type H+-transporting ATPase subunit delta